MSDDCQFGIDTDARGLAIVCGAPVTAGRFAFCDEHRAGLVVTARAAYLDRIAHEEGAL